MKIPRRDEGCDDAMNHRDGWQDPRQQQREKRRLRYAVGYPAAERRENHMLVTTEMQEVSNNKREQCQY